MAALLLLVRSEHVVSLDRDACSHARLSDKGIAKMGGPLSLWWAPGRPCATTRTPTTRVRRMDWPISEPALRTD